MRTRVHENELTGTLTIEADSPAEALSEATARLGPGAQIEAAQTVSRGGVGGFFAKERFQVRARSEGRRDDAGSPWSDEQAPFDIAETPIFERVREQVEAQDRREAVIEPPAPPSDERIVVDLEPASEQEAEQGDTPGSFSLALEAALSNGSEVAQNRRIAQSEILARVAREEEIRAGAAAVATEAPRREADAVPVVAGEVASIDPPPPPPPPAPVETRETAEAPAPQAPAAAVGEVIEDRVEQAAGEQVDSSPSWRLDGPADPTSPGLGRVDWGRASLVRLGMPTRLVEAVADIDVRDDLGWINTIAGVVAPLCRQLPPGPTVMVGAGIERLAGRLGLGFVRPRDDVIPEGSLCATVADKQAEIEWLERMRGNRSVHLVIGNEPWMHLLVDDPSGVSYVTDEGVVDALYVALTLGVPLGYGTIDGGRRLSRVSAIDVALAVRRLVGRR